MKYMYHMGIIAESLIHQELVKQWNQYIVNQRIEKVEGDEEEIWHVYELQCPENEILTLIELLKNEVKDTWYVHAFNETNLYVIMRGKYFKISQKRDESWNEMIEYGRKEAKVDEDYLDSISCVI